METKGDWRALSKCKQLSPKEADDLFFPGSGGKPNKADSFCSNCPVLGLCLQDAIIHKLEGFWAGTTDDQRRVMAILNNTLVVGLELPPEPEVKRVIYLKVFSSEDPYKYLDTIEPSDTLFQTA